MTMPAFAEELDARLPSGRERQAAMQLRQILAHNAMDNEQKLKVFDETGGIAEIVLTPALSRLLITVLRHIGSGDAVTLVPVSQMLTTQQAADILNVSRPYLIGLLEKEEIGFELVGRHRRIKAEDLFAYKRKRDKTRGKALAELAQADADLL
jgi:excisionase family DNA binding protein